MQEGYINMQNTHKNRIEIYLSPNSLDDVLINNVWVALLNSGRGRAPSFIRQAIIRGIRNIDEKDIPEELRDVLNNKFKLNKKRGVSENWKPNPEQIAEVKSNMTPTISHVEIDEFPTPKKSDIISSENQRVLNPLDVKEREDTISDIDNDIQYENSSSESHPKINFVEDSKDDINFNKKNRHKLQGLM